jgi:gamma-glutamyltranspeptidase/glutathione hydrolase
MRPHVAAGDPHTAQAGAAVLQAGGNAVDAAVAATLAACAAEPVLTAPFGGGFALLAGPKLAPVAYDFFATIPGQGLGPAAQAKGLDFVGLEVSFGPTTQVFYGGRGAAAVGLLLPGLVQMQAEQGRLPLRQVVQPAADLAERGVPLSAQVAPIAAILRPILQLTEASRQLFSPHGEILRSGQVFRSPDLAAALRRVGEGNLNSAKEALLESFGPPTGLITAADLRQAAVRCSPPILVDMGDHQVALNPAPSLGGLLVGFGLRLLAKIPAQAWADESSALCHLLACMAITQSVRHSHVDPAACLGTQPLAALTQPLLDSDHIDFYADAMAAAARDGPPAGGFALKDLGSTTHISAMDAQGMACAITSSNGEGCGHVLAGQGFMANNFLGEEDINPGGFHVRAAGERMTSMMCPTIVLRDGRPVIALGTGGSNRIRTALLQVLTHHLLRGMPLKQSVMMPRMHYEGGPLFIERRMLDQALQPQTLTALQRRVQKLVPFDAPNMFFGGVHAAAADGQGVGDPRRGGSVAYPA